MEKDKKILVVGLGLIGGSYAKGLTTRGFDVGAIDTDQTTVDYAVANGYVSSAAAVPSPEYIRQFDILIFCLYPHVLLEWISQYQDFVHPGAVLTDATGVKAAVVGKVQGMLRPDLEFIGAHPMAGSVDFGIHNSDYRVFEGANYIVTPTAANSEGAIALCEDLGRTLGFGMITRLSPEEHDEMIGFLSQLAHCIAISLMTCKESTHLAKYSGDSFRDLTRIASINHNMWPELFCLNKDVLLKQIDLFTSQLGKVREAIASEDKETLRTIMQASTSNRKKFDK